MNLLQPLRRQEGVALVFSLLLLLVLTIIGVAAMNSTIMQERMAGNLRMQTQVFEVASEGVGRALDFYYTNTGAVNDAVGHGDGLMCGFVHGSSFDEDGDPIDNVSNTLAWQFPAGEGEFLTTFTDDGLRLEQQMYCCRSWSTVQIDGVEVDIENPSKLFVLSRGTFLAGEGPAALPMARREVEVKLEEAAPGEPTCAFCVPGGVNSFTGGKSNSMQFHGACGPAITTQDQETAARIRGGIDDRRMGNYDGGITHGDMGRPWNDPNDLAEFVWWIKLGLPLANPGAGQFAGYWDDTHPQHSGYINTDGVYRVTGNNEFGVQQGKAASDYGSPEITYFDRGVDMGGNISGHGIMIINGTAKWNGTPDYDGLLVSLGGGFEVAGGGQGGNIGSMVFTALDIANSDLASAFGGDVADAMGNWAPLPYAIADDGDGYVEMYDPDEFGGGAQVRRAQPGGGLAGSEISERHVPVRPVLRDPVSGQEFIFYSDPTAPDPHRFFDATNGVELTGDLDPVASDPPAGIFVFVNTTGTYASLLPQSDLPRDKFGRLIPNFVPLADLPYNWPHDAIEYSPNRWGWGLCGDDDNPEFCDDPPFAFGSSDFEWGGGGNQAFTYDCRWLQRTRQRLLCADQAKTVTGAADFPPAGYDYDDPDYSLVCAHHEWATEYNDDVLDLAGNLHNQHAWHLWDPKCECLGITANSDMILSGWRENLGWRDDDFAACAGLPEP